MGSATEMRRRAMRELRIRHEAEYQEILAEVKRRAAGTPTEGQLTTEGGEVAKVVNCACGRSIVLQPGQSPKITVCGHYRAVSVDGVMHHTCTT